jgi:hypothetical protein
VATFGPDTADTATAATAPTTNTATGGVSGGGGTVTSTTPAGSPTGTGTGGTTGTTGTTGTGTGGTTGDVDRDGDGSPASLDCDDSDPDVYPGAPELCDGEDQDCDGRPEPDGVCPCPLVEAAGIQWLACEDDKSWPDAEATCASVGFHLAWIGNGDQNDLVREVCTDLITRDRVWIGLTDRASEGDFEWSSGAAFGWDGWDWGEPNDAFGSEDCTEMTEGGSWNDADCGDEKPFLCRRP